MQIEKAVFTKEKDQKHKICENNYDELAYQMQKSTVTPKTMHRKQYTGKMKLLDLKIMTVHKMMT
jgi:hypothetical protein